MSNTSVTRQSSTENACSRFDFTLPQTHRGGHTFTVQDVTNLMKDWARQWVFQLEKSDTGYVHYQGRLTLMKKRRTQEIGNLMNQALPVPALHLSPTSNPVYKSGDFSYAMKADTRVEGPWKDTDAAKPQKILNRKLRTFLANEAFQWQKQLVKMISAEPDTRTVTCIFDPEGNNGKSTICDYIEYVDLGKLLTPMNNMQDLMRAVFCVGAQRCFLIDMPKCLPKQALQGLYAGIEKIKDGFAYDDRYNYRELKFEEPHVVVFTNRFPDLHLLSADRWRVFGVRHKELISLQRRVVTQTLTMDAWLAKEGIQYDSVPHVESLLSDSQSTNLESEPATPVLAPSGGSPPPGGASL